MRGKAHEIVLTEEGTVLALEGTLAEMGLLSVNPIPLLVIGPATLEVFQPFFDY
jgi:hypothetical protein